MANTVIGASVQIEFQSVGNMRKALKEANQELLAMQDQFGATSQQAINAARKVADLKDRIEDARETADLFDPGKKFQAFVTLGSQIAAGFSAVQGAMALVGAESEDVQKALLKVQSAMALAQGLSELKDFGKSWQQMKIFINSATQGLNGFKKALVSSGIGLLVVSVGLLVAYWEDIKRLVTGVSKEQEKLVSDSQAKATAAERELDVLERSGETLKASGKTEKEIAQLKLNQLATIIQAKQTELAGIKANKDATIAQAERYNKIIKGAARVGMEVTTAALRAIAVPLQITIDAVNLVSDTLGFGKVAAIDLQSEITKMNEFAASSVANLIIDPKELQSETDKNIQRLEDEIINAKEKTAVLNKSLVTDNKAKNDKIAAQDKQAGNDKLEAEKILAEARRKMMTEEAGELFDLEQKRIEDVAKLEKAGFVEGSEQRKLYETQYQKERQEIIDKYKKEEQEKEKAFQDELNQIRTEKRLAGITDEREKEQEQLKISYEEQRATILANEELTEVQKAELLLALTEKNEVDVLNLKNKYREEDLAKQKEYNEKLVDADNQLYAAKWEAANAAFGLLSSLAGNNEKLQNAIFAVEKAVSIAKIIIDTQKEIAGYYAANSAIPGVGVAIATKLALAAKIRAGASIAAIVATTIGKYKKGGGTQPTTPTMNNTPGMQTNAPLTPAISPAVQGQMLNADAINNLGNTAIRAFVMNSDIQNNDQRNAYLQRNARIG